MKKLLTIIFMFFLSISNVLASDFNLLFDSEDNINKILKVDLVIDDINIEDKLFYGLTATLEYDDNLELVSIKGKNNFDLTYNDKLHKIVLYNIKGINKKTVLLTLEFNNKNNLSEGSTSIYLKDITISDLSSDIKQDDIKKEIKYNGNEDNITNNNTYLKEITINGKKIDFDKNKINYDVTVSYDTKKIVLDATLDDDKSKIEGIGEYSLSVGKNEYDIIVSNGSDKRIYTININRETIDSDSSDEELFIKSKDNSININKYIPYIGFFLVVLLGIIFLIIRNRFIKNKKEGEKNEKNVKKSS